MNGHWTLDQLRALVEVARTGSFTRAAESLAISQPAVSVQIRTLEQAVGLQLFERRPRCVVLTDAGRILERYARRILNMEAEFAAEISDLQRLERGMLRWAPSHSQHLHAGGAFAEYYSAGRAWSCSENR
jgi:transcriptional regulator, LysR family